MRTGIIYIATNKVSGKSYIGQTLRGLKERKREHIKAASNPSSTWIFCFALRKYKKKDWEWEVLFDDVPSHLLDAYEVWAIGYYDTYNNGYNSTTGGGAGKELAEETKKKLRVANLGKECPQEQRRKISQALKGIERTEETKLKISIANKGHKHSDETKKKISVAGKGNRNRLGHKQTEETKRKISESKKGTQAGKDNPFCGRKHTPESKEKMSKSRKGKIHSDSAKRKIGLASTGRRHTDETKKKIGAWHKGKIMSHEERISLARALSKHGSFGIYKDGELVGVYQSNYECRLDYPALLSPGISHCLSGKSKTHKGYTFKYINEVE